MTAIGPGDCVLCVDDGGGNEAIKKGSTYFVDSIVRVPKHLVCTFHGCTPDFGIRLVGIAYGPLLRHSHCAKCFVPFQGPEEKELGLETTYLERELAWTLTGS